jgi:hypothetical protein
VTILAAGLHTPFEHTYHRREYDLKCVPGLAVASGNISGKRNHGTGILYILKMLARQIGSNHLRTNVRGFEIDFRAFPAVTPLRICEEASQHLSIEVALALEVTIEASASETSTSHNVVE